jgi:hypothetical protein
LRHGISNYEKFHQDTVGKKMQLARFGSFLDVKKLAANGRGRVKTQFSQFHAK